MRHRTFLALAFAAALILPSTVTAQYSYQTIATPTPNLYVSAVKNNLCLVGNVRGSNVAYVWNPQNGYYAYTYPGSTSTSFNGLNDAGYILGGAYNSGTGVGTPFLLYGATVTVLTSGGVGLTNGFLAAGVLTTQPPLTTGYIVNVRTNAQTNFTIPNSTNLQIFGINDNGQVLGSYTTSPGGVSVDFIRNTDGSLTNVTIAGASIIELGGIANGPQVVGNYFDSQGQFSGFVWVNGSVTPINVPGAMDTYVTAVSNSGVVSGSAIMQNSSWVIFFAYPPGYVGPKAY